jgi:hypothetical protein
VPTCTFDIGSDFQRSFVPGVLTFLRQSIMGIGITPSVFTREHLLLTRPASQELLVAHRRISFACCHIVNRLLVVHSVLGTSRMFGRSRMSHITIGSQPPLTMRVIQLPHFAFRHSSTTRDGVSFGGYMTWLFPAHRKMLR